MVWKIAISVGLFLTVLGLVGLGMCISRAMAVRKAGETEDARQKLNRLVAWNMASVGIAFFGLAFVVVGLVLAP